MELASSLCPLLVGLIHEDAVPIDRIEAGPWNSLAQIRAAQNDLPGWKFQFHDSSLPARIGLIPGTLKKLRAYHAVTDTPWASVHFALLLPGMFTLLMRGWRLPMPDPDRAGRRLLRQVRTLQQALDKPAILENMPALPVANYLAEVEPDRIATALESGDLGLLLDLAHARTAAATLQIDIYAYLNTLPLERVRHIHVSGPRAGADGRLLDAHEPLQAEDYALLEWVLARTNAGMLTLEYWKQRDPLLEQLRRLRAMIG